MKVDLHMHTNCSDGIYPPEEVVKKAEIGGLDVIAIADHDCVEANEKAQGFDIPLKIIRAVEVTSYRGPDEIHILGYFKKFDEDFKEFLKSIQHERLGRIKEIVSELQKFGVDVTVEKLFERFGATTYTRGHLVFYLMENGYGATPSEVFEKYLKDFSVPISVTPEGAVSEILKGGGIPVWAHPVPEEIEKHFDYMLKAGIKGIEAYNGRRGMTDEISESFVEIAREHDLLVTAGSDWHGYTRDYNLGDFYKTEKEIGKFLKIFL